MPRSPSRVTVRLQRHQLGQAVPMAFDATTGKLIRTFGQGGSVDLTKGLDPIRGGAAASGARPERSAVFLAREG
jgi:glucose dehydrogenase